MDKRQISSNPIGGTLLQEHALTSLVNISKMTSELKGCIAEVGVYKGGSLLKLVNEFPNDQIYGFDTFEGMPEVSEYDNIHIEGDFYDTSFGEVKNLFINNSNVTILKGEFPKTNSNIVKDKMFKFVHLDVDIYSSYKLGLEFFYPRMVKGGIILCDDYNAGSCLGAKTAVDEFVNKHGLTLMYGEDWQAYFII